jgi:hypothetical protein
VEYVAEQVGVAQVFRDRPAPVAANPGQLPAQAGDARRRLAAEQVRRELTA